MEELFNTDNFELIREIDGEVCILAAYNGKVYDMIESGNLLYIVDTYARKLYKTPYKAYFKDGDIVIEDRYIVKPKGRLGEILTF